MTVPALTVALLMMTEPVTADEAVVPVAIPVVIVSALAPLETPETPETLASFAPDAQAAPRETMPQGSDPASAAPLLGQAAPEEGEILVTGRRHDPGDPLEGVNVKSFQLTQAVDDAIIRPTALAYQRTLPAPLRDGIRNVLNNLREPVTFLNNLLQFKVGRAARTLGRFAVNSTVGVAGLVDMARRKPFRIERKVNGFANTLGYYGVKTGIFFYLPIIGPTTVRDLIGTTLDRFVLPFAVGKPFDNPAFTIPAGVFGTIDNRAQFDETLQTLHHDTPDAYVATREFYLARRRAEIDELHGKGRRIVRPTPGSVKPHADPAK